MPLPDPRTLSEPPQRIHSRDFAMPASSAAPVETSHAAGRLIAVIVGCDEYSGVERNLDCAVNDAETVATAIRQTHPPESLDLALLTTPPRENTDAAATRENMLRCARRAASLATPDDTVVFYFAGHGGLVNGRSYLFPGDARLTADRSALALESVLAIEDIQRLFDGSPCPRRVMFLDCCQGAGLGETTASSAATRGLSWRTGLPVSNGFLDALRVLPHGWSVLLGCGPGQLSLEDPVMAQHGIFTHFLAAGLGGEADLDNDGVVSLAELIQYIGGRVSRQARAVLAEAAAEGCAMRDQTPALFWAGPASIPLTRRIASRRLPFQSRVLADARRYVFGRLPYPLPVVEMMRHGMAGLIALVMGLSVLRFLPDAARADWLWIAWAAAAGLGCGLLWLAMVGLAAASNKHGWHTGGYVTGAAFAAGCTAVFGMTVAAAAHAFGWPAIAADAGSFAASVTALLSLVIIFGFNAVQSAIVLADEVAADNRVLLRRVFRQLDQRWMQAELPNRLAMVSGHPMVYQILGFAGCGVVLAYAAVLWLSAPPGAATTLGLARAFGFIVLILWQVQWYGAAYASLRREILPAR